MRANRLESVMGFARPKKREPVGEAGLFEYAVGALARRMRTERDLRRLMKLGAEEGEAGGRARDGAVGPCGEGEWVVRARGLAEDDGRVLSVRRLHRPGGGGRCRALR